MFKIKIGLTPRYKRELRKYIKKNKKNSQDLKKGLSLFILNVNHPSLHVERLSGLNTWTFRLNRGDRVFFKWYDKNTILLIDIGSHDKYKKNS